MIILVSGLSGFHGQNIAITLAVQRFIKTSPFQVVYGRRPPSLVSYEPGSARVEAVERSLIERDEFLKEIRDRLLQAIKEHDT